MSRIHPIATCLTNSVFRRAYLCVAAGLLLLVSFAAIDVAYDFRFPADAGHLHVSSGMSFPTDYSIDRAAMPAGGTCTSAAACMAVLPAPEAVEFQYSPNILRHVTSSNSVDGLTAAPETPPPISHLII